MHKIGETSRVTLENRTFDVELTPHHKEKTLTDCERDCPEGWQIPTHTLLQSMRNNPSVREKFGLLDTFEYVQNPDTISRQNGYVAGFFANSDGAILDCNRYAENRSTSLGVRYCREIKQP